MDLQIKFRAWDRNFNRFVYTDWNSFRNWYTEETGGKVVCPRGSSYEKDYLSEPMKSLWLKDKTGKTIFEFDIIEHPRHSRPHSDKRIIKQVACLVVWSTGKSSSSPELNPQMKDNPTLFNSEPRFRAEPINDNLKESRWGNNWSVFHDCTIIGNKFQNAEMLNVQPIEKPLCGVGEKNRN